MFLFPYLEPQPFPSIVRWMNAPLWIGFFKRIEKCGHNSAIEQLYHFIFQISSSRLLFSFMKFIYHKCTGYCYCLASILHILRVDKLNTISSIHAAFLNATFETEAYTRMEESKVSLLLYFVHLTIVNIYGLFILWILYCSTYYPVYGIRYDISEWCANKLLTSFFIPFVMYMHGSHRSTSNIIILLLFRYIYRLGDGRSIWQSMPHGLEFFNLKEIE